MKEVKKESRKTDINGDERKRKRKENPREERL
jgi:hypothetical protein